MNKTWSDMSVVSLQEEKYAKHDALKRVDVLVCFPCAQNLNTASTWFEKHFAADNVEIRCTAGGFNTCIESKTLERCAKTSSLLFLTHHTWSRLTIPSQIRTSAQIISCDMADRLKSGRSARFLPPRWKVVHEFLNLRFSNMEGASPAPDVVWRNARITLAGKASGVAITLCERSRDNCITDFKASGQGGDPGSLTRGTCPDGCSGNNQCQCT